MSKAKILSLGIFALLVIIIIFVFFWNQSLQAEKHNIRVVFERSGGLTPVDWHDKVIVENNGLLKRDYKKGEEKKVKKEQLASEKIKSFKKMVLKADVFTLKDSYRCGGGVCPTDLPSTVLKFKIDDKTKTISMYMPEELPSELERILKQMREFRDRFKINK